MKLTADEKLVVILDVCSSSKIVGFLSDNSKIEVWERLLGGLKNLIWLRFGNAPPNCYKFIGDGWILLLPTRTDSAGLLAKLKAMSDGFKSEYEKLIESQSAFEPQYTKLSITSYGLTFGVDSGFLLKTRMINKPEYLGPALNIATRLQGKAKEYYNDDAGGCLVTSDCAYQKHFKTVTGYNWQQRETELHNIDNGKKRQVWTCKL